MRLPVLRRRSVSVKTRRVRVFDCRCERCGHEWRAASLPDACAKCKSKSWNVAEGSVPLGRKPLS